MKQRKIPPGEVPHNFDTADLRDVNQDQSPLNKNNNSKPLHLSDTELYGYPGSVYEEPIDQEYVQVQRRLYGYDPS